VIPQRKEGKINKEKGGFAVSLNPTIKHKACHEKVNTQRPKTNDLDKKKEKSILGE